MLLWYIGECITAIMQNLYMGRLRPGPCLLHIRRHLHIGDASGTAGFAGKDPNSEEMGCFRCFKAYSDHLGDEWETDIWGFEYHEKC